MYDGYEYMVSIICETYNHAPYVRQCIEGFLMQKTDFAIEILIHDDASTDGTPDIIREYADKHPDLFKPIYQVENQYSKGINIWHDIQFPRARGKYIAICEGDDYWTDPLKLQKQVEFLESNSEYVLCHTDFNIASGQWRNHKVSTALGDNFFPQSIEEGIQVGTATVLCRKDVYQRLPKQYIINNWPMGDYPLWIEYSYEGKIKFLPAITACYRVLNQSASHGSLDKELMFANATLEIKRFYAGYYNVKLQNNGFNKSYYLTLMKIAYKHNSKILAKNSLIESQKKKMLSTKQVFLFFAIHSKILKKIIHLTLV